MKCMQLTNKLNIEGNINEEILIIHDTLADDFKNKIKEKTNQRYIKSCTVGIEKLESELGLKHIRSDNLEDRQNRCMAKSLGGETCTPELILRIAKAYNLGETRVVEHFEDYIVEIKIVSTIGISTAIKDLEKTLRDIVPSHVGVLYKLISQTKNNIFVGAACITGHKVTVYPWKTKKLSSKGEISIAGPIIKGARHIKIYPKKRSDE